jgi:hypothetical protein
VVSTFARHQGTRLFSGRISERMSIQNSPHTTQDLKYAIQDEIAFINEDQNLFHWVFDDFVGHLTQDTLHQEANFMSYPL